MPFQGVRIGVPTIAGGGATDPYAGMLMRDDFSGTVAALNGRLPQKGAAWAASGASAGVMQAGGGQLKQTNDTPAAYAFSQLSQNPGELIAKWQNDNGAGGAVPTLGICPTTVLTTGVVLHFEHGTTNPFIRAISSGTFLLPAWSVVGTPYALVAGKSYTSQCYWDGKFAKVVVYDGATIIGQEVVYEPMFATGGGVQAFWETLNSHLAYTYAEADPKPGGGYGFWPTLNILAEQPIPTTATASATVFGGSVTNNAAGLIVTGAAYGQGAYAFNIGATAIGDKIWFSFDAASITGNWECALLATGASETEKSNIVLFAAAGRVQGTLTATEARGMSLAIAIDSSAVGGSVTISNLLIIKNPPTTP